MTEKTGPVDMSDLESKVDDLVVVVERLSKENTWLKNEHSSLIKKSEQTRIRLEAMIERLKALETS